MIAKERYFARSGGCDGDDARQQDERELADVAGVAAEDGAEARSEGVVGAGAGGGANALRGAGRAAPEEGDPVASAASVRVGHAGLPWEMESWFRAGEGRGGGAPPAPSAWGGVQEPPGVRKVVALHAGWRQPL